MSYDYLIVGSGIGGLYTALLAQNHGSVLILTKSAIEDCNTAHAQGGIAAPVGPSDSPELHLKDTLAAGAGLSNPEAARAMTEEALACVHELIDLGVPFDTLDGHIALGLEAAHSVPRILHAGGDATGAKVELTLSHLATLANMTIQENHFVTEILVEEGKALGVRALDTSSGRSREFTGRFIIMATGGAGQLFLFTTNPQIATGDGVALAYRAALEVMDLEFYQFHPTALNIPGVPHFLISEAVRGEGGILRNGKGRRFMLDYHLDGELAPRDIVARAIMAEMQKEGSPCVYLDATHLAAHQLITRFPTIYRFCLENGLDITASPIPVAPAAHYMMGGIKTNIWGETNIPNLFACGEVACTGVHGANRLASNSLLEALVFGRRIVTRTLEPPSSGEPSSGSIGKPVYLSLEEAPSPKMAVEPPSVASLQALMWENVGLVRSKESLEKAKATLTDSQRMSSEPTDRPSQELANKILTGRLITQAALAREESRGAHFRSDFPRKSTEWRRHIIFRRSDSLGIRRFRLADTQVRGAGNH